MFYILYKSGFAGGKKASRALLDQALRQYAQISGIMIPSSGLEVHETENGKPYVENFDHFSVSHTGDEWAVLFSHIGPCGFDIQQDSGRDQMKLDRTAERWYTTADAAASAGDRKTFFRIWSRREAYVKAIGGSVMMRTPDMKDVPKIVQDEESRSWLIQDLNVPGGNFSAACIPVNESGRETLEDSNFKIMELEQ